jgi:hypothetical protein
VAIFFGGAGLFEESRRFPSAMLPLLRSGFAFALLRAAGPKLTTENRGLCDGACQTLPVGQLDPDLPGFAVG